MSKRLRFLILLGVFAFGGLVMYPTFEWYVLVPDNAKEQSRATRLEIRDIASEQAEEQTTAFVNMLNGISKDSFEEDYKTNEGLYAIYKEAKKNKKEKKESFDEINAKTIGQAFENKNAVYYTLLDFYRKKISDIKDKKSKIINLGLDLSGGTSAVLQINTDELKTADGSPPTDTDIEDAISRSILILQSRIDKFGLSEPRIRKQGKDSILIEVPGDNDREKISSFIQGKGAMSFQIVNDDVTEELISLQEENPSWIYDEDNVPSFIPGGTKILEYVERDEFGIDKHILWIAVYVDVDTYGIDGAHLKEARVSFNQLSGKPEVSFQLDRIGADKLSKLTNEYINQSMAIILDDKVRAYARLSAVITNGQAVISGFDKDLADSISKILQTASLPVSLQIVNQNVIGPSLGQAVIDAGLKAITIGFLLVIVFMLLYYKGTGFIAIISLFCNMFLLLSLLSAFNFTLTLTGIAGVILTIGMAVDSNVLIFERIKEELRLGKSRRASIDSGFQRAFWTIVDANLTTFIASFFISQIASGPIQGFAVTLSLGIVTTLFSSLFISRLLFDFGTDVVKRKTISISWRKI